MNPSQVNASHMDQNMHHEIQADTHNEHVILGNESKFENGASSPSSSSDTSSDEDFFQLDANEFGNSRTEDPQHAQLRHDVITPSSANYTTKHEPGNLIDDKGTHGGSPELPLSTPFSLDPSGGSPSSDVLGLLTVKQSPPIQVMGRSDVPDPNRIPSSIFARTNTTTPMDWSMASNESLFSIHMGNSSFSRDHVILLGKSQELGNFSTSLLDIPPPAPAPVSSGMAQGLEKPKVAEAANSEAMNDVVRAAAEEECADKERTSAVGAGGPLSSSTSRISDGSVSSFAFPILTGETRDGSIKVGPEHQPISAAEQPVQVVSRAETPKAAPSTTENKWFSCFSCCPLCR